MNMVVTVLGDIPEGDLRYETSEVENSGDTVVLAREWFYAGSDPQFSARVGERVRRDVWVTVKRGAAAQAVSEL